MTAGSRSLVGHNTSRSRLLNNLVSPYGLAMISYAFFLFSCLIPPSIYSSFVAEPDKMFLDPTTILFYTLCVMGFVAGVWLLSWLLPPASLSDRKETVTPSSALYLLPPLIFCVALSALSSVLLLKSNPLILPLFRATSQRARRRWKRRLRYHWQYELLCFISYRCNLVGRLAILQPGGEGEGSAHSTNRADDCFVCCIHIIESSYFPACIGGRDHRSGNSSHSSKGASQAVKLEIYS
jgi:hypothetical protein